MNDGICRSETEIDILIQPPLSVVFMGTPDFAVPSLLALCRSRHHVQLVVTQPDRPKGRGRKVTYAPVKEQALALKIPVWQPKRVSREAAVKAVEGVRPDLLVVVAFGQILRKPLLEWPRLGAVNVHGSLLPNYRGAAPIQWAMINGEKETGVTTMLMDQGVDTGDMLLKAATPIAADDTAQSLHDRLAKMGSDLLLQTLDAIAARTIQPIPQDNDLATFAPMLSKKDGEINWRDSAVDIVNRIRAMNPWPGTYTLYQKARLAIHAARVASQTSDAPPGTVIPAFDDELHVVTGNGVLEILELQRSSGKRLQTADFIRGCPIFPGSVFGRDTTHG